MNAVAGDGLLVAILDEPMAKIDVFALQLAV